MYENERKKIQLLRDKIKDIEAQCRNEGRQPLPIERDLMDEMREQANHIEKSLPQEAQSLVDGPLSGNVTRGGSGKAYALRGPQDTKDYKTLFGSNGASWNDRDTTFFIS